MCPRSSELPPRCSHDDDPTSRPHSWSAPALSWLREFRRQQQQPEPQRFAEHHHGHRRRNGGELHRHPEQCHRDGQLDIDRAGLNHPVDGDHHQLHPPAAVASATTATLTASAAGLTGSSTITINPLAAITVAGVVVDFALRNFPGVSVIIGAQSTVTDANGHFSIANVTPPYDLTALGGPTFTGAKGASLFKGITRTDPVIMLFLDPASTENMGTLTGTVTGGDVLGTVGERTVVSWGSTQTPPAFRACRSTAARTRST